jgi:hypothetical protein
MIENSMNPETIMNWSKFAVYFKIDDPYFWPALSGKIIERIKKFHCDQLLVILVNVSHSLSSEASNIFSMIGSHLGMKMDRQYIAPNDETLLTEEDIINVNKNII